MIKIISKSYQSDEIKVTIEFDLGGTTYSRDVEAQISQVLNMSVEQIKTWVINFVINRRGVLQIEAINALLDPLINVDLEG